ncbi:MAG: hypothetical protein JWQ35_1211 [Bacteriovoracaceae bacterium]|nr:hypothetical protein [Bacteriovoracaceae bacterium]
MADDKLKIVFCGLSITSSWGNGHATTYRSLVRELTRKGHDVLFLERDQPWYAKNRDVGISSLGRVRLYSSLSELIVRFSEDIQTADAVIVGSYVPDGVSIGNWVLSKAGGVRVFYDIDTPVTLAAVASNSCKYISKDLISKYDLYLSFTGGPLLQKIENVWGSPKARAFYCSIDVEQYYPEHRTPKWDLGFLGTYSPDRQATLERLLLDPARILKDSRFVVAGAQFPENIQWGDNIERIAHLAPPEHRHFYNSQKFTLNTTRREMRRTGYSPSIRLFEAAACGTVIVSDPWTGLDEFFEPDEEILIARTSKEVQRILTKMGDDQRREIGINARHRVLSEHSSVRRTAELEFLIRETYAETSRLSRKAFS